jgi:hypothetical protein
VCTSTDGRQIPAPPSSVRGLAAWDLAISLGALACPRRRGRGVRLAYVAPGFRSVPPDQLEEGAVLTVGLAILVHKRQLALVELPEPLVPRDVLERLGSRAAGEIDPEDPRIPGSPSPPVPRTPR